MAKLKLADGTQLPDPLLLSNGWHQEMTKMPPIKWWDITNYIMKTPSPYTQDTIRNLKANEAHEFYANGHVQDVYMNDVEEACQFSFIKSEVCIYHKLGVLLIISKRSLFFFYNLDSSWSINVDNCFAGAPKSAAGPKD